MTNKMRGEAVFIVNGKEIDDIIAKNESMETNIPIPELKYETEEFFFRLEHVSYMYKNSQGNLNVLISGEVWTLKYNDEIYSRIKAWLTDGTLN